MPKQAIASYRASDTILKNVLFRFRHNLFRFLNRKTIIINDEIDFAETKTNYICIANTNWDIDLPVDKENILNVLSRWQVLS